MKPHKLSRLAGRAALYLVLVSLALFYLLPFFWLVRSSVLRLDEIFVVPPIWVPTQFEWGNFVEAMTSLPFGLFFLNTFLILVPSLFGSALTSSLAAFSFSRMTWAGRDKIFGLLLTSLMLPSAVTLIPVFIGWRMLGAIDTFVPLIVPAFLGGGAFNIFLFRQFFLGIPKELDEAAKMEGAGFLTIYAKIILPLSRSALIVVCLFGFLFYWNDFFNPLIFLTSEKNFTISLGLQLFQGSYNSQWNLVMAASTVIVLPAVAVFLLGQRYIIQGISMTGLKA
jgi:multiple sugar transport system permease protein